MEHFHQYGRKPYLNIKFRLVHNSTKVSDGSSGEVHTIERDGNGKIKGISSQEIKSPAKERDMAIKVKKLKVIRSWPITKDEFDIKAKIKKLFLNS